MPTYEYACTECGKRFDVFQRFSERSLKYHEECGGALRKVFHPAGIVFKGPGFYTTDSRGTNGSKSGSAEQAKPEASKSESKKTKSEKKSASAESKDDA